MAFSKARRLSDLVSSTGEVSSFVDGSIVPADLNATLDLTGKTVTVATASAGDNDTSVASTAFVSTAISNLVDSSPSALNTLNELAAALGDDANFSTTVTNSIATKLPLAGGTMTGKLLLSDVGNATVAGLQLTDAGLGISSPATDQLNFITADATRMVITNVGNVGIGATPIALLDGNAAPGLTISSNGPYILLQDANNSDKVRYMSNNTGVYQLGIVGDNGTSGKTEHLRIDTNGKVGIGDNNPTYNVGILGSGNTFIQIRQSGDSVAGHLIGRSSSQVLRIQNSENADTEFWTNNQSRMKILADGKVGIGHGVDSPATQLDVVCSGAVAGTFTRTSSDTASITNTLLIEHETSGDMADGFGPGIFFGIKDGSATTEPASITVVRDGHDNAGSIRLGVQDDTGTDDYDALVVSSSSSSVPGRRDRCYARFDIYNGSTDAVLEEVASIAGSIYRLHDAIISPGKYSNGNYYRHIGRKSGSSLGYVEFKMDLQKATECFARFKVGNSADSTARNARLWYSFDGRAYTQADNSGFASGTTECSYTLDLSNKLHDHIHYTGSVYWRCGIVDNASSHETLIGWDWFEFKAFAESMTFDGGYERGVPSGSESLVTTSGQGTSGTQVNYVPSTRPYAHQFTGTSYAGNTTDRTQVFADSGHGFLDKEIMRIVTSPQNGIQFLAEGIVYYSFSQDIITTNSSGYISCRFRKYNSSGNANIYVGYHLLTNTGGNWDGATGSGVFDVNPGDIIKVEFNGANITNMDGGNWSYYNFLWLPLTTSGTGNGGGNSNFPFAGASFS